MNYYVLGIDAAWTAKEPSGVALLEWTPGIKPTVVRAGRSYEEFCSGRILWKNKAKGLLPNIKDLLLCCKNEGFKVDLVSIDIPLSPEPILGRRKADNEI